MRNIYPSLLSKINLQNQTHYNNANPKMKVSVARARSSIMDSSYFTVETIRTKEGIGDISVAARRLKAYGPPDRLYEIHLDSGIAKTAIREYPDKLKEGWKNGFDVGAAIAVAIAFDGRWVLNSKKKWQMITNEQPYIFWVDSTGKLYKQLWDDVTTIEELAANVVKVKAIRAWKNTAVNTHDQGVIVAYIKSDGKVYYRSYCEQADYSFIWENEREVTQFIGMAVNLNLFLTNDYRTGFLIEDNLGKIHWLITSRNWASMAIAPEKIVSKLGNLAINFLEVNKIYSHHKETIIPSLGRLQADCLYASSYNEIYDVKNIDDGLGDFGKLVIFKTIREIFDINTLEFTLVDKYSVVYSAVNVEKIDSFNYQVEFINFNNASGDVTFKFNGIYGTNAAGYNFNAIDAVFTPTGLIPDVKPAPEVEVIWNE